MKQEVTFTATEQSTRNAFVRWNPYREAEIADGFKEAADAVVAHALEQPSHPDRFLFPIAFMYRHSLEVELKILHRKASHLTTTPLPNKGLNTHDLVRIWQLVRRMIEQVWPQGNRQELDRVEQVIRDFQDADPRAQAFRYEVDTKGEENLKAFPDAIAIDSLRDVVTKAYELLDGCEMGIDHYLDLVAQMEREHSG